ncbi:glycosyltransferase [Megasphaera elsdenii]
MVGFFLKTVAKTESVLEVPRSGGEVLPIFKKDGLFMPVNYSVLMSVYYKEHPDYLRQSMQSIYDQTVPTDDFVLVCDGPLTPELDAVIADMQLQFGPRLNVCRLLKNGGLGKALNFGIGQCKNDLVARMDSDDVSRPDRCERQLAVFRDHSEYSLVSGIVEEFSDTITNVSVRRIVPERQNDIIAFAKKRNPFNHPCIMYKKNDVEAAGGYQDFYLLEDYYLWIRMLQQGFIGYNLQEPLLWMRAGSDMYKRRGGWKYVQSQRNLFKYMAQTGFITGSQYQIQSMIRLIGAVVPNWLRAFLFKQILRNR